MKSLVIILHPDVFNAVACCMDEMNLFLGLQDVKSALREQLDYLSIGDELTNYVLASWSR